MKLLDTTYVDIKIEDGIIKIELPLVSVLETLAKDSSNKVDDVLVELVKKALEKV